jgi:hypothetical protein
VFPRKIEPCDLPSNIIELNGQKHVPFGDGALSLNNIVLSSETFEELFTPNRSEKKIFPPIYS